MTTIIYEDVVEDPSSSCTNFLTKRKEETKSSNNNSTTYSSSKKIADHFQYDESAWDWYRRVQQNRQQLFQNPVTRDFIDYRSIRASPNKIITQYQAQNLTYHLATRFFLNDQPMQALTSSLELFRRFRSTKVSDKCLEDDKVDDEFLSFFFKGTGISFIDQLFQQYPVRPQNHTTISITNTTATESSLAKNTLVAAASTSSSTTSTNTHHYDHRFILDVTGKSGTAKTPLLVSMVVSYIVATSLSFLGHVTIPDNAEPIAFIIDPEYKISISFLAHSVRKAVLKRWNQTETLRKLLFHTKAYASSNQSFNDDHVQINNNNNDNHPPTVDESCKDWFFIEKNVSSCLERIHIIHPTSTLQIIATLELIRHSLDQRVLQHFDSSSNDQSSSSSSSSSSNCKAPTMIIIDSFFTCFESIDKRLEDLPSIHGDGLNTINTISSEKSGLSGRNDVVRQIKRLCARHSLFVVTSRTTRESITNPTNRISYTVDYLESWNKLVTHRLQLDRVIENSKEDKEGFAFVALLPSTKLLENNRELQSWTDVIPFIVSDDGVQCRVKE